MANDGRIDAYIEQQADFARPILTWLRARVHAGCPDVEEGIKWGIPAFGHKGRRLAHMAAFKRHATFGFSHREQLATGREGEAMGQFGRITALDELPGAAAIEAMVREAVALIDAGQSPKRAARPPRPEAEIPAILVEALARDPVASANFDGFSPSCRREYCEWIGEAKRDATREKRLAEAMGWIREGKKRSWKYERQ